MSLNEGGVRLSIGRAPVPARRVRSALSGLTLVLAGLLGIQSCTSENVTTVVVNKVTVIPTTASAVEGEFVTYRAEVEDDQGRVLSGAVVTWSSGDSTVASIDSTGVAEALNAGATLVSASFQGSTGSGRITVTPAPKIGLSLDTLRLFGQVGAPSPAPVTIDVTNSSGVGSLAGLVATVEYPVGDTIDWLAAVLTLVTAPTPLTLTSETSQLPFGSYEATVVVTSAEARNSPVELPVILTLTSLTIEESDGSTVVGEAGDVDAFTVVLDGAPTSDVVLDITSADTGEATVGPARLTFTPSDWDTPQSVTVTGVDDDLVDGPQSTVVTIAVNDTLSDDTYDPIEDYTVTVTTQDDDSPGLIVIESGGATIVTEAGGADDFTVELQTQPLSNVVIQVASEDTGEVTVAPARLTYTPASWNIAQTVTVTGADDPLIDGSQVTAVTLTVDDAASDDDYDGLAPSTVDVTTTDNDDAGFTITEIGGTSVSEAGGTDDFTVLLVSQPASNVVLAVSSADPGEVSTAPATLTFTPADWDVSQTVTLTGVDDDLDDGDQITVVTVSVDDALSDDNYDGVPDQTVNVTTVDDDAPGFTVIEIGGTTVTEGGGTDNFTVRLNAQPTSDVVLDVTSADIGEATVAPVQLTFTPVDWATVQTVTVTGVDDDVIDGDQLTVLTVSVDPAASDDAYDALADQTVTATTQDNDAAGIMIAESDGSTLVNESGTTDGFTVRLDAQPSSDVVFDVTSADPGEAVVAPARLTFTPASWSTAQTVQVTGVDDALIDGTQLTTITVRVDPLASDDDFDGVPDGTVVVTTTDDDAPGFTTSESGGSTEVAEAGGTDVFGVALDSEPLSDVVLTVVSSDTGEATVAPAALTFTPANWSVAQTVTVTGEDEAVDDGDQISTVTISVDDANSDDDFDALPDRTVSVTTLDDDEAGFTVVESGTTEVTEAGSIDDFTVVLDAQPTSDVVLQLTSGDPGEASLIPATITFTSANWNAPRNVTVTGVDDALIDGPQVTDITIRVDDAASDDVFDPLLDQIVQVTTTDDDSAGFTITEIGGTVVTESGSTDDFNVVLDAQPQSNVSLTLTSSDTGEATVSPLVLAFTPASWNTPRTVTVSGVDDDLIDGDQITRITVSIDDVASDDAFDAIPDQTVSATTTDDDAAGFSIIQIGGTQVTEAGSDDDFSVVLDAQPLSNVVIAVTSLDPGEASVGPASLIFTPGAWNVPLIVTVTGVDDDLIDGDQVTQVVLSVNDALSDDEFDPLPDQSVDATTTDDDVASFAVTEIGGTQVTESGGTDNFTVVLGAQPSSDVVFDVSSGDLGEVTVGSPRVTFTSGNWNVPQTVTVAGVDDDILDGTQTTIVTVSVDPAASDNDFDALQDQTVSVQTADDDAAGFEIEESGGNTLVNEGGTSDVFTVVLTAQPGSDVELAIASGDIGEATVGPATLTFTALDWETPQTVTVTGADDNLVDGSQFTDVTVSVNAAASDDDFDALPPGTVTVTTTDDDAPGFITVETDGSTSVTEDGGTDQITVVLGAEPASDVVLSVTSSDVGEVTVSPSSIVFTSANWDSPRNVTLTGVDDLADDGNQVSTITVSVDDLQSDDAFDPLVDQTVSVTTVDDDDAGFIVVETGGTSVTEAGSDDTFTVVLSSQPSSDVQINISSGDTSETTVAPGSLTFTNLNWSVERTVTVTGVDDALLDGNQVTIVTLSVDDPASDDVFDPVPDQTVSVTTADDDVAGFIIDELGGVSVSEFGSNDDFTVRLSAQPTSNVVLTVTSQDTDEATAAPTSLVFSTGNWGDAQTVTVTGVDDDIIDGTQSAIITVSVNDAASDDDFDGLADQTVIATTTDNDAAGFTITEIGGTSVTEAGPGQDDFTVVLDAEPVSNVVLTLTASNTGEATVAPASIVFTPQNWAAAQVVTVDGVDDFVDDGDQVSQITVSVNDAASDNSFDPLPDQTVSVTTIDDDTAGYTVTEIGGTSVSETGATDDFTVVLDAQPLSNVELSVISANPAEAAVSAALLRFTPADWNSAQTVTVTGVDDDVIDGDQFTDVTLAIIDASSDDVFDPLADFVVTVTTTDDDVAGFTLLNASGKSVTEAGTTDEFMVVLDARPDSDVEIDVTGDNPGEATVSPASLRFTPGLWNTPQTVTVTGQDEAIDDGDQITSVTLTVDDAESDDNFDGVADQIVTVTTIDNDGVGFTIVESGGGTSVNETDVGPSDSFTVRLDTSPLAGEVVIDVTSGDTGEVTVSPPTLTFNAGNWSDPQTVDVTGVDDQIDDDIQFTQVTLSVDDALTADVLYQLLADQVVTVTTGDDDTAGFQLANTVGKSVAESGTTDNFTVVLTTEPESSVEIDVVSSDPGEVAVTTGATLTFTSGNWNIPAQVVLTGVDDNILDGDQITTLTVSVDDANSDNAFDPLGSQQVSATTTDDDVAGFTLVNAVGKTVTEFGGTDNFTVELDAQPSSNVQIDVSSSDVSEVVVSAGALLTFTPANWNAPQSVTLTGIDDPLIDGDVASLITVAVNDAASDDDFDAVLDQPVGVTTTDNDVAGFTVVETAGTSVTEAGGSDSFTVVLDAQPNSNVQIDVSSGDPTEVAVTGGNTLIFTPATWDISQTVTVTGVDDDLVDGPQITAVTLSVNDAASDDNFDGVADATVNVTTTDDDIAGFVITEFAGTSVTEAGGIDSITVVLTAEPFNTVQLTVVSGDITEVSVSPPTVTFTGGNWNIPQKVTISGVDDAIDDGNRVTIVTLAVNDAVSDTQFDPLADQFVSVTTIDDDVAGFTLANATGKSVTELGGTDSFTAVLDTEPTSNVTLTVASADIGEATVSPATLLFTPANWNSARTITITGVDDPLVDGNQLTLLTVAVDDGVSDDVYDPLADQTVSVTTVDDDVAGFTVTETGGSTTVTELGSTDEFTVVLDAQPTSNVVLTLVNGDSGEISVSPLTLLFTPAGWNAPQTVTVTGVNDAIDDGDQLTSITISVDDANSDDVFDPVVNQAVSATTTDDDVAGFTLSNTAGKSVAEAGGSDNFSVVLDTEPTSNVLLNVSSEDLGEVTVGAPTLLFTPANWSTPQTVTLTGANDAVDDGDQNTIIRVSVNDAGSDNVYDPLPDQTVSVTTIDDDTAGFILANTAGKTVTEAGGTDDFTVALESEPTSNVVIDVTSSDESEVTVTVGSTLIFTPANWNAPRTVTLTGADDALIDGSVVSTITLAVNDAASDDAFDPLPNQQVSVTTTDNDVAGFTLANTAGKTVTEAGGTDGFTVVLDAQPNSNVELSVSSGDPSEVVVTVGATRTFTPANWNSPQAVTLTGVDDDLIDGSVVSTITVAVNDAASDNNFDPLPNQQVSVTTTDDDVAGFTLANTAGKSVTEAGGTDGFTVVLDAQPNSNVEINVSSGDLSEVVVTLGATRIFTPANWNVPQAVTLTGVDDDLIDGSVVSTITVAVNDAASDNNFDPLPNQQVSVITTDDDVAGFTLANTAGKTVTEAGGTDDFTVVLDAQPNSNVVINVSSGDPSEVTVTAGATLLFTPANWSSPQTVTLTGADDDLIDGSVVSTITIAVNDGASDNNFDPLPNQQVSVTTTDDDVAGFTLADIVGLTVDELGATDEFTVVLDAQPNSNVEIDVSSGDTNAVVVTGGATLVFTPSNWSTAKTVTLTGVDDGVTAGNRQTLVTMAVDPNNSDDAFDAVADQSVTVTTTDNGAQSAARRQQ